MNARIFDQKLAIASYDECLVLLMPKLPENAVFARHAKRLLESVLKPLVYLRDHAGVALSMSRLKDALGLPQTVALLQRPDCPLDTVSDLKALLASWGYRDGQPLDQQAPKAVDQCGYASLYLRAVLGMGIWAPEAPTGCGHDVQNGPCGA